MPYSPFKAGEVCVDATKYKKLNNILKCMFEIRGRKISYLMVIEIVGLTFLGLLIPTLLFPISLFDADFFGLSYEQIIGMCFGFILGVLIAQMTDYREWDFADQVKRQTFSFVGFTISILSFFLQVVFPREIPSRAMSFVTPMGDVVTPSDVVLFPFAIVLAFLTFLLVLGFFFWFIRKK